MIESGVHFNEVKEPRIGNQRSKTRHLKICPTTGANQVLSVQSETAPLTLMIFLKIKGYSHEAPFKVMISFTFLTLYNHNFLSSLTLMRLGFALYFSPRVVTVLITEDEQVLSFGIQRLNQALPGFKPGDFAVLYGHQFCKTLAFHLSVQCQLPRKRGGLNSSTIYVDGGNTFNPYAISDIARECGLDPKSTLERIFVSRAFTAYQLSALILETLENALKQYRSKLVLVSDITSLFLDKDVPAKESIEIFKKLTTCLSDFVKRRNIIVVATYFHEQHSRRRILLESVLLERADTTIKITDSTGRMEFTLESHPALKPFTIELLPRAVTLERFVEA